MYSLTFLPALVMMERIHGSISRVQHRFRRGSRAVAITLTCRCGKQLNVHDNLAGKRVGCPACASALEVPRLAVLLPEAAPLRRQAVRSGEAPVRSPSARPPAPPGDKRMASEPAAAPGHRHVG